MTSVCDMSIKHTYYVNALMNINTSGNNDTCWMKCAASLPASWSTDPGTYSFTVTETTTRGIFATFASIPGTILNLLVLLAMIRSPELRKEYLAPSIASITVTDFLFSVYVLPATSYQTLNRRVSFPEGCTFYGLLGWGLWMVSAFNLTSIAGLRCFAINYPRKTKDQSFQYGCKIIPILAWVLTLAFFLPSLTHQYGRFGMECKLFICNLINVDTEGNPMNLDPMAIYFMMIVFSGIILLILNVLSYVQVSKQSQKLFNQIKDTSLDEARKVLQNEKKLQKMVGLITASFLLVYFPLAVVNLGQYTGAWTLKSTMAGVIAFGFADLVVVFDPLVYIYSSEKYRNGIKMILNPILYQINKLNRKANQSSET